MNKVRFGLLGLLLVLFAFATPVWAPPPPYCWDISYTYCSPPGTERRCTDGIYTDYLCVCRINTFNGTYFWDCDDVR